jgi:uncharacterized membrane protein YphA (DoxX/SURF4 family)
MDDHVLPATVRRPGWVRTAGRVLFGRWTYLAGRLILGGVFIWAGTAKLLDPAAFAGIIAEYGLLPSGLVWPAAMGLPALEILAGAGLVFDVRWSLEVVVGLLLLFVGVLWFGILSGLDVDCGCFSAAETDQHDGLRRALGRDGLMVGLALWLYGCRWWRLISRRRLDRYRP